MDFFSLQATAVDRCADLPKLCTEPRKIAHIFRKQSTLKKISKYFIFKSWYPSLIFFTEKKIQKFPLVFDAEKKKLKVQILQSLRRLFIILIGLIMTWFNEKVIIFNMCICGLMPNLTKKSWTVSSFGGFDCYLENKTAFKKIL